MIQWENCRVGIKEQSLTHSLVADIFETIARQTQHLPV